MIRNEQVYACLGLQSAYARCAHLAVLPASANSITPANRYEIQLFLNSNATVAAVRLSLQVHRWGAAFPAKPFGSPCLKADTARLAACGDFCMGGGIENAVLSGQAAAEAMCEMLAGADSRL